LTETFESRRSRVIASRALVPRHGLAALLEPVFVLPEHVECGQAPLFV
jgi:hypothetical protein